MSFYRSFAFFVSLLVSPMTFAMYTIDQSWDKVAPEIVFGRDSMSLVQNRDEEEAVEACFSPISKRSLMVEAWRRRCQFSILDTLFYEILARNPERGL